jgi:hypothetical protein
MTPPKKPEWFELTQADGVNPRTSVKTSARGVLLALPLMLIGAGVVIAQTADESPALAESVTTVASAAPQVNGAPGTAAIKSSSVKQIQPAIATPPTGGGDDDDYEEEDDEEEGDEDGDDD